MLHWPRPFWTGCHLDGHVVDHAATLETAQDYLSTTDYDLILLDIMLPDGDARSLLKSYRMAGGKDPDYHYNGAL